MSKDLLLIGAGGFGREVMWLLTETNQDFGYNILGFIDDTPELIGKTVNNYPVFGGIDWLLQYPQKVNVLICLGSAKSKKKVYEKISRSDNFIFPTIIAADVKMSTFNQLGQGCIICSSNILTTNITLGNFVTVNIASTVGHDTVLGDFVTVYPGVNIAGNVSIAECCEVGTGTSIIQGVSIGENTIIGAGSVVVKEIPANCTAVGAPAKPIKYHQKATDALIS